jgi:hypothetical protein
MLSSQDRREEPMAVYVRVIRIFSVVLTGHAAGGFYVREYAREFPFEVAGIVLIDSSSPEQIDELPGWRTKGVE